MRVRDGFMIGVLGCLLALSGCDEEADPDAGTRDSGMVADTGPGPVDSGPGPVDSGPADAGPTDAGPTDAGPTDAGPVDAGPMVDAGPTPAHCGGDALIIAEIDPGVDITVFNPTDEAIDTSSGYRFCQRPQYPTFASLESGLTIPAGGSHTFAWPSAFSDTDAGGELAIYTSGSFGSAAALVDFVCWGTGRSMSRRSVAEMDGDWSGDCAGAITESLTRIPDTDGTGAASYDPAGASAALSCD